MFGGFLVFGFWEGDGTAGQMYGGHVRCTQMLCEGMECRLSISGSARNHNRRNREKARACGYDLRALQLR